MAYHYAANTMSPHPNRHRMSGGMMVNVGSSNNNWDARDLQSRANDVRGGMTRRFTTNALPTLSPIGQQRRQAAGDTQISERKIRHIEVLLEQQRRIAAELEQVDTETRLEVEEGLRHERAVSQIVAQSEPTTPPAYQDAFPAFVARPNRYSAASATSTRSHRSSTHLTSPSAGVIRPYTAGTKTLLPSQSVPGSRRHSDDEEEDRFVFHDTVIHRAGANPNRNSMPVTSYDRTRTAADLSSAIGPLNTTSFLFDEDAQLSSLPSKSTTSPPDAKTYLHVQHTADGFPKLIRRDDSGTLVSAPPTALDLALSRPLSGEQQLPARSTATRHRISLPPTALSSNGTIAPLDSVLSNGTKAAAHNRRSVEVGFAAENRRPLLMASPPHSINSGGSKAQSSYSTNDVPTLRSIHNERSGGVSLTLPHLQSNNVEAAAKDRTLSNLDRIASGSATTNDNRPSHEPTSRVKPQAHYSFTNSPPLPGLQANATPFGPYHPQEVSSLLAMQSHNQPQYMQPAYYGNYGMQTLNNGLGNMNVNGAHGGQGQWPNQPTGFQQGSFAMQQQHPLNGYSIAGAPQFSDGQKNSVQQRKAQAEDFYNAVTISDLIGQLCSLCKDQHGCRFLQRKLEERDEQDIQAIFVEVKDHFQELMVDPFGNYLCQRLLEYANDEQRTALVDSAGPSITKIALNQHGTRALQRMIEFISTQEQTNMMIEALRYDVVQLIQDLNGNHVIQKCLNHLSSQDAQFIFDAVGANCVIVGTHRHGCCVLQRCVDHASGSQKGAMVDQIIANAFSLVQDPFGNYVVQYILDLSEPSFTEPLCLSFVGSISYLSRQKFSSNVIEKCIRCAGDQTKRLLIQELVAPAELEKLLRDSFANYVVQTAMDFADDTTKAILIENIRPILPAIRHTPYGRRIQGKIQDHDAGSGGDPSSNLSSGSMTPNDSLMSPAQLPSYGAPAGRANRMGMVGAPPQFNSGAWGARTTGPHYPIGGDITSPIPQRSQAYNALNGGQGWHQSSFGNHQFSGVHRSAPTFF